MFLYVFMAIFLVLAQAIVAGAHFLIFKFIVKVFSPTFALKNILFYGLLVLSFTFVPASLLIRGSENSFSRSVYFLVGLWHGLMVNLLLAILGGYILFWLLKSFGINIDFKAPGAVFIFLALVISAYGVYNANSLKVKNIKIYLKDLPSAWEGKTAVQISDVHLGNVLEKRYADRVAGEINKLNPEIVFITGDYFDGIGDDSYALADSLSTINSKKGIYFVTGNHETYVGEEKSIKVMEAAGVTVLQNELRDIGGLLLLGLSYPIMGEKKDLEEIIKSLSGYDSQSPSILLYHSPSQLEKAAGAGIDLMLSGHSHRGQIWPFNFIAKLIFKGYDYGLKKKGDTQVYTSSGAGVWGPTMRTSGQNEIVAIELRRAN